jgi:hypothetical protein
MKCKNYEIGKFNEMVRQKQDEELREYLNKCSDERRKEREGGFNTTEEFVWKLHIKVTDGDKISQLILNRRDITDSLDEENAKVIDEIVSFYLEANNER